MEDHACAGPYCRLCDSRETPLIDRPRTLTGRDHPATSRLAADRVLPRSGTQRRRVYDFIKSCGDFGATDDEIVVGVGLAANSVRPRRVELADLSLIERIGRRTRLNAQGNPCDVWVAT